MIYVWAKLSKDGTQIEDSGILKHMSTDLEVVYDALYKTYGYTRQENPILMVWDARDCTEGQVMSVWEMVEELREYRQFWGGRTLDEYIAGQNDSSH